MSLYSLQADISTLQLLQQKVIMKLIQKQESFQTDKQKFTSKNQSIGDCLSNLKACYESFATEFKNQWLTVYNQLLEVFRRIIQLYQMKVNRLEEEVEEKDWKIKELENQNYKIQFSQNYLQDFWQESSKQSKVSEWEMSSTGKRVKISDVIAENSHNCSIQTPYHSSSIQQPISEQIEENQTQTHSGRALLEITEQLNRNIISRCFQKEKNWENQVSPIMNASSHRQNSPIQTQKQSFQLLNKENKSSSNPPVKTTKNLDSWKSQTSLSTSESKLEQLRKSLIHRKKSSHLYMI